MSIVIVFFSSYRFLGRQRIGSVKVQAKLKCNARGYYTTPYFFSSRDCPQTPPRVFTTSFTPSVVPTRSFSGSRRTTFAKAVPSHNMQARGASWGKYSGGQILARNSSRLVYSFISVSPGLNEGIKCHGRNEFPVEPPVAVDPPPLEASIFPGSTHFRSKQPGWQR